MSSKLFSDSEVFQNKRPNFITDEQKEELLNEIVKNILEEGYSSSDEEDIKSDIESIYPFRDTGFELAKSLDSYSADGEYDFKSDFIEFLEHLQFDVDEKKEENVKDWVKAHDIKPKLADGSKLIVKSKMLGTRFNEGDEVYINYHYPETAKYVVDKDPNRKGGTLIDFEKIELNCTQIIE